VVRATADASESVQVDATKSTFDLTSDLTSVPIELREFSLRDWYRAELSVAAQLLSELAHELHD
jgi:hypothetical protein